jgi:hypothetical protein
MTPTKASLRLSFLLLLFLTASCASKHYSEAILLSDHDSEGVHRAHPKNTRKPQGNTIYIGDTSKFSVELEQIFTRLAPSPKCCGVLN